MNTKQKLFFFFAMALSFSLMFAQEMAESISSELDSELEMVSEASKPTSSNYEDNIEMRMDKWRDGQIWDGDSWIDDPAEVTGRMIEKQVNESGGMLVSGIGLIIVPPTHPEFGKFRTMAYEKALNAARKEYLLAKKQSIGVSTNYNVDNSGSDDDLSYKHDLPKTQLEEIARKALALTGAELDKKLEELGVDKEKYSRASEAQRHVLLTEAVGRNAVIRSFGELSGLMPVQTFEGYMIDPETSKKTPAVGVICSVTPNSRQLAKDILHLRGDFPASTKKGIELEPYFRSIDNKLLEMFGVRRMKDENGYPVLVAFGQWSSSKRSGNPTLNLRYADLAKKQADTWARTELSLFLNSNYVFDNASEMGELYEEAVNVMSDDSIQEDNVTKIMDKISENLRGKSYVNISGVRVIRSWSKPHPDNPKLRIYGVVIAWSPAYEQAVRNLDKPLSTARPSKVMPQNSDSGKNASDIGSRQSEMIMDLDDF